MSFFSSDSQRFDPTVPQETTVRANISGPALFKWRYNPLSSDTSTANIFCYFEKNGVETNVINRKGSGNAVVQTNDIRNTELNNKVQGYVNSTDPSIFGFRIDRVTKLDPMVYRCIATFGTSPDSSNFERSRRLQLQLLGNIGRVLLISFETYSLFKVYNFRVK